MFYRFKLIAAVFLLLTTVGCRNMYRDFGDKSSDEYLIAQAQFALDNYDYATAINAITPVLVSQPNNETVVYLAAAARAGRAGLRVLDLFVTIGQEASTKGLIQIFAEHFIGADDDDIDDIKSAINIITNYNDDPSERGAKLNFFTVFLYFSEIGIVNSRYGLDADGILNPDYDPCTKTVNPSGTTGIPSASIDDVIAGFVGMSATLPYSGSDTLSGLSFPAITTPATSCDAGFDDGLHVCAVIRTMLNSGPTVGSIGFEIGNTACIGAPP